MLKMQTSEREHKDWYNLVGASFGCLCRDNAMCYYYYYYYYYCILPVTRVLVEGIARVLGKLS